MKPLLYPLDTLRLTLFIGSIRMMELDRAQARRFAHISKAVLFWTHHCERSGSPMTYSTNPRRELTAFYCAATLWR